MIKRFLASLVVFALFGAVVFGATSLAAPNGFALPGAITAQTPCPVAACTQPDGGCHAAQAAPVPNGSFTMLCPKVEGCSDTSCHAWDRLTTHYNRPSDSSLNLWILVPVVFTLGLVLIVRKTR
ncbi:MAG: hypothetical protein FWF91_02170 [Coriobacteriia bacterium]|nr:hypothetical protein [Coriobacteriia bacterium]